MTKPRFDKPPAAAAERLGVWSSHKEFPSREPGGHASPARSRSRGSEGAAPPRRGGAPRDHGAPGALTRCAHSPRCAARRAAGPKRWALRWALRRARLSAEPGLQLLSRQGPEETVPALAGGLAPPAPDQRGLTVSPDLPAHKM